MRQKITRWFFILNTQTELGKIILEYFPGVYTQHFDATKYDRIFRFSKLNNRHMHIHVVTITENSELCKKLEIYIPPNVEYEIAEFSNNEPFFDSFSKVVSSYHNDEKGKKCEAIFLLWPFKKELQTNISLVFIEMKDTLYKARPRFLKKIQNQFWTSFRFIKSILDFFGYEPQKVFFVIAYGKIAQEAPTDLDQCLHTGRSKREQTLLRLWNEDVWEFNWPENNQLKVIKIEHPCKCPLKINSQGEVSK